MRRFMFFINLFAIIVAAAIFLYCTFQLIMNLEFWITWLMRVLISLVFVFVMFLLFIIRKTYYPLSGVDYK